MPSRISIDIAVRTPPRAGAAAPATCWCGAARRSRRCVPAIVAPAAALARLQRILLDDVRVIFRAGCAAASPAAAESRAANRPASETACRGAASSVSLLQRAIAAAFQRCTGSTKPSGRLRPWSNTRAMRARSSGSVSLESAGIDIGRQRGFLLQPCDWIFVGRQHEFGVDTELCAMASAKRSAPAIVGVARVLRSCAISVGILPDRHAVLAPIEAERPARQAFAGIPFALAVMQQAARREARRAAGGSARRLSRAWSGRRRRCSIPALRDRRSRRRSARRPW